MTESAFSGTMSSFCRSFRRIRHRLQQPRGADHRRAEPGLEPGGELSLEPQRHRRGGEHHGDDEHRVHHAVDQPLAHRSTSPMIGSSEPRIATASLTLPPGMMYGQRRERVQARGPDLQPVGELRPVRDEVGPELAARRLDGHVHLAVRNLGLHRQLHRPAGVDGSLRHRVHHLPDQPHALPHLSEANAGPRQTVSALRGDHVHLHLVVGVERGVAAEVVVHAAGPEDGAGDAQLERELRVEPPHPDRPVEEDAVLERHRLVLVRAARPMTSSAACTLALHPAGRSCRFPPRVWVL